MNSVFFVAAACVGVLTAHAAVPAEELRQNYQSIIERNSFGLKPLPERPAAPPPPQEKKPEVEYFLTGITSVGHPTIPRRAYIMTKEQGQKEPKYYALSEWEPNTEMEIDGIKVLSISPKEGEARVSTPDGELLLSFKTHGVPPPASAPVAGVPGAPGTAGPGGVVPPPPGRPPNAYARPLPTRAGATITTPGGTYNRGTVPARTVRTRAPGGASVGMPGTVNSPPPLAGGQNPEPAQEPIDPALQYLNLIAQEQAAEQQGLPFPPLPPVE